MTIKTVLAEMTDAEVRTWIEEAHAESWAGYSRDEMLEELISLGKAGCVGTEEMTREELEKDVFSYIGEEALEDPADEAQVAEDMNVWLQENRSGR